MTKNTIVIFTLFTSLALFLSGCIENSTVDVATTINADSVENYDIAAANNAFAFDMYSNIKDNDENIFFSPHSIFTAMAICYDGAENSTKEQIANVFHFPLEKSILEVSLGDMIDEVNSNSNDYELETANALWIQKEYPIKEQYVSNVENYYSGKVTNLDFVGQPEESRNTINDWVEEKTNNKIMDLIPSGMINKNTRLIITNAIYFNGKWKNAFDKGSTKERAFHPSDEEETLAKTMFTQRRLNYGESSDAKILELPYKGNNLSMYVVLPNDNDIEKFETGFSVNDYEKLRSNMDSKYEVKVWIPKFTFETKTELSEQLKRMGMPDAFDDNMANFSGISDRDLKISKVIHQAFVDVQEEGTEAAAATAIMVSTPTEYVEPEPEPIREFKADHPFMFFIEDKRTNCILFMGKVGSPEYEEMS